MANWSDYVKRQTTASQRNAGYIPTTNKTASQQYRGIKQENLRNAAYDAAARATGNATIDRTQGVQNIVALPRLMGTASGSGTTGNTGSGSGYGPAYSAAQADVDKLYSQLMNYGPFKYDLTGDMLYRQMADQYTQLGQMASRDAQGQAAALTGGYGNSYGAQVGNQMYQQYLTALNEQIPELYDRAYSTWEGEYARLLQQYQLAQEKLASSYSGGSSGSSGGSSGDTADDTDSTGDLTADIYAALLAGANGLYSGQAAGTLGTDSTTGTTSASGSTSTPSYTSLTGNDALDNYYYRLMNSLHGLY